MSERRYSVALDTLCAASKTLNATLWWRRGLGGPSGYYRIDLPNGKALYGTSVESAARVAEERVWLEGAPAGVGGAEK